ncbi:GNAT family N-acetyltransferase [Bacteroidia bacterium]|jgi:GNAT superfamily N-acetyltransferase|nr:GNAT family N-acetyltransferase [Bacteroidia bacterium]
MNTHIRAGLKSDLPKVLELINDLALFEKAPEQVTITLEQLEKDGFEGIPLFHFLVAESNHAVVGMAFYYFRYSTWKGKVLYLEDFVVKQEHRSRGIGKMLFNELKSQAVQDNCVGMSWQVLDWNEDAIRFYKSIGAELDDEWLNGKLML